MTPLSLWGRYSHIALASCDPVNRLVAWTMALYWADVHLGGAK